MKPASLDFIPSGPNAGRVAFVVELNDSDGEVNLNFLRADADVVKAFYACVIGRGPHLHPQIREVLTILREFDHVTLETSGKVGRETLDLFQAKPAAREAHSSLGDLNVVITAEEEHYAHFDNKELRPVLQHPRVMFRFHLAYNGAMPGWERFIAARRIWVAAKVNSPENIAYVKRISLACDYGIFSS